MLTERELPENFRQRLRELAESYVATTDPLRQSGYGGGPKRWRPEREPLLNAVVEDGDFLDIGCANGYLLECLVKWGKDRGVRIVPYGLDLSQSLIALARRRLPRYDSHFYVGNAWDWCPPRRYRYVYSVYDCVPEDYLEEYVHRILRRVVAPGGRLIVGAYGSRSQGLPPFNLEKLFPSHGLTVAGIGQGGDPVVAKFIWVDNPRAGG